MKSLQDKQQGLRTRLRNNQREIKRLMTEYDNFGAVVVSGHAVKGMDDWIVEGRPKRSAPVVRSPDPLDNTQTTDASTQPSQSQSSLGDSQISDAASEALEAGTFSDDYTGSSEEDETEERSVNTETGMPDTQASDSPYLSRSQRKRRKQIRSKRSLKKSKKTKKKDEDYEGRRGERSPPRSPSY